MYSNLDENPINLVNKTILERYIKENHEHGDQRNLTDGKSLTGSLAGQELEPILWVILGAPFFAGLVWGGLFIFNDVINLINTDYIDTWVLWAVYFTIFAVIAHYSLKSCLSKIAQINAKIYFVEGVEASFRQLYLAKTELEESDYDRLLNDKIVKYSS